MGGNDDRFDLEEMNSSSSASDQYQEAISKLAKAVYGEDVKNVGIERLMMDATTKIEGLRRIFKQLQDDGFIKEV